MSLPEQDLPSVQVKAFDSNGALVYKEPVKFLVVNQDKVRVDELFEFFGRRLRYQSPDGIVVGSDGAGFSNVPFPAGSVVNVYRDNVITEQPTGWTRYHNLHSWHNMAQGVWNWKVGLRFSSLFHHVFGCVIAGMETVNKED